MAALGSQASQALWHHQALWVLAISTAGEERTPGRGELLPGMDRYLAGQGFS